MKHNLLILGAGQYGMVAKEIAESMGCFETIDFLDDGNAIAVGKMNSYAALADAYDSAIVAIGNADVRLPYIEKLNQAGFCVATLISPRAYVAPSARIGVGSIVEPMAVVNAHSTVGIGTIICAGAIVNHNAVIGDGCLFQCGSMITAGASVPDRTRLEYGEICFRA